MADDGEVVVDTLILRRWDSKRDKKDRSSKKPVYVIEYRSHGQRLSQGAAYAYSQIEAASVLARDVANNHKRRIQLVCDHESILEDLYYAADFIVMHHNAYIDRIDPVMDDNPFGPGRTVGGPIPQHIPVISHEKDDDDIE